MFADADNIIEVGNFSYWFSCVSNKFIVGISYIL